MIAFSQNPYRSEALLEHALREQERCEHLYALWKGLDAQTADNSYFDAGALSGCIRILRAAQRGEDILEDIATLIDSIAGLNDERLED